MAEFGLNALLRFHVGMLEGYDISEIQSFLGLAGYYKRFVEGFSLIVAHMTKLLQKCEPFNWIEEQQDSFGKLKSVLTHDNWNVSIL